MDAAQAWARYWSAGQTDSCFSGAAPFDGSPRWNAFFRTLESGARVIDLACGGGALTRLAVAHDRGFQVTGVDFAESAPAIEGAVIRSGVALERLDFEDAAFDAAVSQFGLEYAETGPAVREIARVLRPGGRFAFLMHHADSAVSRGALSRRERLAPLLAEEGPVRRAVRLGELRAQGREAPDLLQSIKEDFVAARAAVHDEASAWAYGYLGEVMSKHRQFPPAYLQENAATLLAELESMALRLDQMLGAARSAADVNGLVDSLAALGCLTETPETVADDRGELVAWWVRGRRSAR
ncbi:MAG: class I SAM-dependent methyltransferase [Oceanicaulis sp.]